MDGRTERKAEGKGDRAMVFFAAGIACIAYVAGTATDSCNELQRHGVSKTLHSQGLFCRVTFKVALHDAPSNVLAMTTFSDVITSSELFCFKFIIAAATARLKVSR